MRELKHFTTFPSHPHSKNLLFPYNLTTKISFPHTLTPKFSFSLAPSLQKSSFPSQPRSPSCIHAYLPFVCKVLRTLPFICRVLRTCLLYVGSFRAPSLPHAIFLNSSIRVLRSTPMIKLTRLGPSLFIFPASISSRWCFFDPS